MTARARRWGWIGLLAVLVVLGATGCGARADTNQPPQIAYGQDSCDRCQMITSEENMAAAYWTTDGQARRFDDIAEMVTFEQETGEEVATRWVHDLHSGEWLNAAGAYFVLGSGVQTPMGSGIVALDSQEAADALAFGLDGAMVVDYGGLQSQMTGNTPGSTHQ